MDVVLLVTIGMVAAAAAGWRVGTLMSPRPRWLREAAAALVDAPASRV
jgi:hypothetical protein